MLTPRDIHEAEFKRVWKGYNPEEVDAFLQRVVGEYEAVYRENEKLRERVDELKARLQEYSKTEVQIDEILALAKQAAEDVNEAAQKEADAILSAARSQAEEIRAAARRQAEQESQRIERLSAEARRFRSRVKEMLEEFEEEVGAWDEGAVQEMSAALRQVAAADDPESEDVVPSNHV